MERKYILASLKSIVGVCFFFCCILSIHIISINPNSIFDLWRDLFYFFAPMLVLIILFSRHVGIRYKENKMLVFIYCFSCMVLSTTFYFISSISTNHIINTSDKSFSSIETVMPIYLLILMFCVPVAIFQGILFIGILNKENITKKTK